MGIDISVIIVSYNVRYFLEQCLHAVWASRGNVELEVLVVDNASSDDTPAYLSQRFPAPDYPNLHVMANSGNVGFGRANNQALKRAKGDYVLFLNPDTLLTEDTLAEALAFARRHPDMGALGTMMLQTNGNFANESRRGLPTPWTACCKMTGLAALFPRSHRFGRYYMRYLDKRQAAEIEVVSGAFMMIPRKVLESEGAFDERFFMYGEDIDLSYRLLQAGLKNYYIPSPILHYKGESTQKSTYRYVHVFYGAMLIFFKKHYHHYASVIAFLIKTAIFVKAFLALLGQMMHRFKTFVMPDNVRQTGRQLYVGHHAEDVLAIAEQNGLDVVCLDGDETTTVPQQIAAAIPPGCVHVIFDTADFSRRYVLDYFRNSNHKQHIGTYSPKTQCLITGSYTLPLSPAL